MGAVQELLRCLLSTDSGPDEADEGASGNGQAGTDQISASKVKNTGAMTDNWRIAHEASVAGRSVGGRALMFVWALEQNNSRRGGGEEDAQDVMVPWVKIPSQPKNQKGSSRPRKGGRGQKYECDAGVEEVNELERDKVEKGDKTEESRTFHRYYHLYRKGELEEDVLAAGGKVVFAGYEKDNWWVLAARKDGMGESGLAIEEATDV